jgi:hypothetical protein
LVDGSSHIKKNIIYSVSELPIVTNWCRSLSISSKGFDWRYCYLFPLSFITASFLRPSTVARATRGMMEENHVVNPTKNLQV